MSHEYIGGLLYFPVLSAFRGLSFLWSAILLKNVVQPPSFVRVCVCVGVVSVDVEKLVRGLDNAQKLDEPVLLLLSPRLHERAHVW